MTNMMYKKPNALNSMAFKVAVVANTFFFSLSLLKDLVKKFVFARS